MSPNTTQIVIHGAGRMGEAIASAAAGLPGVEITAIVSLESPTWSDAIPSYFSLADLPAAPDLLIDFTLPSGTEAAAEWCLEHHVALLSGVTGLSSGQHELLRRAARRIPILWSPNLSVGVNLLADLAARATGILDADTPVCIEDLHHQWKKDAPSGTALMLGDRVCAARGGSQEEIDYRSVREGEHVGVHTVTFRLQGEEISLVHHAHERGIYARGALSGGLWLVDQPAGLYTAADWLESRGSR